MKDFTTARTCNWLSLNRAPLFLITLVVCMFSVIELKHPYFFLQDDNLKQNLPLYVHNLRSILGGEFPLFNFHQFLGTPVFSCIQSAALYPPNYAALLLSKLFLGHYYGTMEIIALFHLVLASLGFFRLMRFFGLNEWSCCFGAIAWTFCSFVIVVGHAWIQVLGYAAYFPWILLFSLRQIWRLNLRHFAILVVLRVLDLYLGYPPYFIYSVTFDVLTVSVLYFLISRRDPAQEGNTFNARPVPCGFAAFLTRQGINYLCVLLIAAPLLLPAMHQIEISAERYIPLSDYSYFSYTLSVWLNGLFTPFSDLRISQLHPLQFISHIGWLTLFFCVAALWQRGINRKLVIMFLALAFFSLLWASNTFVTGLFYYIPVYNQQRWPFKLAFFTSFFLITTASFGLDVCYQRFKKYSARGVAILVFLFLFHIGNFMALYIAAPEGILTLQAQLPPYNEPMKDELKGGRILSIVPANTNWAEHIGTMNAYYPFLGFNFATLFDLYHFAGYEVLVSRNNLLASLRLNYAAYIEIDSTMFFNPSINDMDYYRKWGVAWYVVCKPIRVVPGVLRPVFSDDMRTIFFDPFAKPFVYWLDDVGGAGLYHNFTANSIIITADRRTAGELLINVLHNNFFKATIDREKTEIMKTVDGQMLVNVPSGRHIIKVVYSDPYFNAGIYVLLGFLTVLIIGWILHKSTCKRFGQRVTQ